MPDISMCKNHMCALRQDCYRYTATPNEHWQAYCSFEPESPTHCRYQMTIEQRPVPKKQRATMIKKES